MRIDIMTLFPETVGDMMNESILGRAQERGFIRIEAHQIRDYTVNKQKQVDDYPYGGGRGAVMQADPCTAAGPTSGSSSARSGAAPSTSPPAGPPSLRPRPGSCWRTMTT